MTAKRSQGLAAEPEEKRNSTVGIRVTETEHSDFISRPFDARRKITVALRTLLRKMLGLSGDK